LRRLFYQLVGPITLQQQVRMRLRQQPERMRLRQQLVRMRHQQQEQQPERQQAQQLFRRKQTETEPTEQRRSEQRFSFCFLG
jgi:hypothetical protein